MKIQILQICKAIAKLQFYVFAFICICAATTNRRDKLTEHLNSYTIIADFEDYPDLLKIGDHLFWSYNFDKMASDKSHLTTDFEVDPQDIPITLGSGLLVQHLNRGRVLFLAKKYQEAARIWRSAALKFKKGQLNYSRLNFFTSLAYMKMVDRKELASQNENSIYQVAIAANLMSDALADVGEQFDPLLDRVSSKYFYYLSTLYYLGGDVGKSAIAAQQGINTGISKEKANYRSALRFLLADTFIQNRDYLMAAQQLDAVIREEANLSTAMRGFEKLGDLYASLHNYRLANDFYGRAFELVENKNDSGNLSAKIGEAKFWLGDYLAATKFLEESLACLETAEPVRQWARVRLADIILVQQSADMASVAYFDVVQLMSGSPARDLAQIRGICVDLPFLFGSSRNLNYATAKLVVLSDLKFFGKTHTQSLATTCYISSLISNPKEYIKKINAFSKTRPDSLFIQQLATVSQNIQREKINHLLANHRYDEAVRHYEALSDTMYKDLNPTLAKAIFRAYVILGKFSIAKKFYSPNYLVSVRDRVAALDYLLNSKNLIGNATEIAKISKEIHPHSKLADASDLSMLANVLDARHENFTQLWVLENFDFSISREADCQFLAKNMSNQESLESSKGIEIAQKISGIINNFKQYDSAGHGCLQDLAEVEFLLHGSNEKQLAQLYLKRATGWWKTPHIVDLAWQIAESIDEDSEPLRRAMFEKVVEFAPAGTLARTYAVNQLQDQSLAH